MKTQYLVRYGEIGLKGKNRGDFEKVLVNNIKMLYPKSTVKREYGQIVVSLQGRTLKGEEGGNCLKNTFGIIWFAKARECKPNLKAIAECAVMPAGSDPEGTFAVRATRSDKSLEFTSRDIENYVGEKVRKASNLKVDLKNPDITIYISAGKDKVYIFDKKLQGPGGMPVGTSGKVLSLLSGGFDSIASSYLMAKRGAQVDYLHFHALADERKVLESKINKIVYGLKPYLGKRKLHLASYSPFQIRVMDLDKRHEKQELVVFRRLMVKVAEKLAQKHGYQALVLGDSLGQVASQTMENMVAVDKAVAIPIFRPLVGMDKIEIINLVKKIGLEKVTNEKYKDCCSIVSKKPATKANLRLIEEIEGKIDINKIVKEIMKDLQGRTLKGNKYVGG